MKSEQAITTQVSALLNLGNLFLVCIHIVNQLIVKLSSFGQICATNPLMRKEIFSA
jgi:hypothetical protein